MEKENSNKEKWKGLVWLTDLFDRYYQNQATEKEKQIVESWNPEKEGAPDIRFLKRDKETDMIWQAIVAELGLRKITTINRWETATNALRKYAAAAVIALALGGTAFYFVNTSKEKTIQSSAMVMKYFESGHGERKKMTLPDGSTVYLNSDTKLGVATASFNKEKREIWIEEGEAFFEVTKNPEKPFIVHSQHLETTVKGTSFNVTAYKELDQSAVSVRSGKVEVRNQGNLVAELTKNKQITYNKLTGKTQQSDANWEDAAGWVEGRLIFKQAGGKEIKLRLQQFFDVSVEIKGNALNEKDTFLNSNFPPEVSLKEALEVISLMSDVKYKIVNPQKVIIYQ